MKEPERLAALKKCLDLYRDTLEKANDQVLSAPEADRPALREQQWILSQKIEHSQIEIRAIEDNDGLIKEYTTRQQEAYKNAQAERDSVRRKAFEERARFCEVMINEALERKQTIKPLPEQALNGILADLERAAQEAKSTVDSINESITLVNRALDGLILLAKVAARLAV